MFPLGMVKATDIYMGISKLFLGKRKIYVNSYENSKKMEKTNGNVPCENSTFYGSLASFLLGSYYKRSEEKE